MAIGVKDIAVDSWGELHFGVKDAVIKVDDDGDAQLGMRKIFGRLLVGDIDEGDGKDKPKGLIS